MLLGSYYLKLCPFPLQTHLKIQLEEDFPDWLPFYSNYLILHHHLFTSLYLIYTCWSIFMVLRSFLQSPSLHGDLKIYYFPLSNIHSSIQPLYASSTPGTLLDTGSNAKWIRRGLSSAYGQWGEKMHGDIYKTWMTEPEKTSEKEIFKQKRKSMVHALKELTLQQRSGKRWN